MAEDDIIALCEGDGWTDVGDGWGDELLIDTVSKGTDCVRDCGCGRGCIVDEEIWTVPLTV